MRNTSGSEQNNQIRLVRSVKLTGLACAVPEAVNEVLNLADQFGEESVQKIIASTGVERRHIVSDECSSDLCLAAAKRLMADMSIDPDTIDTLIFVSQTPDYTLPATACILQEKLGLSRNTAAFDLALGCSGYVYGLWLASSLLSAGGSKRALLLVGDTISKIVSEKDRAVAALFGDAGSATLLEYDANAAEMPFSLGTDGRGAKNLIVPGGGFRDRHSLSVAVDDADVRGPFDLYMNGAEIFAFTLARVPALVKALSESTEKIIDKYVFHQANRFMLQHLSKRMKLPEEKVVLSLRDYGNTSCASIPLAISQLKNATTESIDGRYMLAGFGVGYSWAGCITELNNLHVSPLTIISTDNQK